MFVLILPEGYTLDLDRAQPVPRSAKIFDEKRLAVYWKPEGKYGADVKVLWGLQTFEGDIRKERDRLNAEVEKAENVPDNPGVRVDGGHIYTAPPQNLGQAIFRTLWTFHPRLRLILLLLAGVILAGFAIWNSLPGSIKQKVIEGVPG